MTVPSHLDLGADVRVTDEAVLVDRARVLADVVAKLRQDFPRVLDAVEERGVLGVREVEEFGSGIHGGTLGARGKL